CLVVPRPPGSPLFPYTTLFRSFFHITNRGVAKCAIFRDDFDRAAFRELLLRAGRQFAWRYDAWCLMTTHFHFVLAAERPALSAGDRKSTRLNSSHLVISYAVLR